MKGNINSQITKLRTSIRKKFHQSDLNMWRNDRSLRNKEDSKIFAMASYVLPNSKIIEFGAERLTLKEYLPENCTYTPLDITDRGLNRVICDINATELPDFDLYHYAIFNNIIEYVNDVPHLIQHLYASVNSIVVSYHTTDAVMDSRNLNRWVNDYSEFQLIQLFLKAGFVLKGKSKWDNQTVFHFKANWQKRI